MLYLVTLKNPSKIPDPGIFEWFLDPDSDADNFQNLITFSLSTDTSLVKILMKIRLVVLREISNR